MTGVLFACAAGLFFGALNITMRRALVRAADVDAGSAVIATLALVLVAATAVASGAGLDGERERANFSLPRVRDR